MDFYIFNSRGEVRESLEFLEILEVNCGKIFLFMEDI